MKYCCLLLLFIAASFSSYACTLCDSKTATAVRASVFGTDLLFNLATTVLPFIICLFIVYCIYQGGFTRKNSR